MVLLKVTKDKMNRNLTTAVICYANVVFTYQNTALPEKYRLVKNQAS